VKIPESLNKYNIGKFNDPKNAILPIVWQCRYMGINVPEELIESFYMNEKYKWLTLIKYNGGLSKHIETVKQF
jgi:hypothetical protein